MDTPTIKVARLMAFMRPIWRNMGFIPPWWRHLRIKSIDNLENDSAKLALANGTIIERAPQGESM
jgi:hypothetical protein